MNPRERNELVTSLALSMAEDDAGIDSNDEDALQGYGENSFFTLVEQFADELTTKTDDELKALKTRFAVKGSANVLPDLDMYNMRTGPNWEKGGPDVKDGFFPCELCLRPVNPKTGAPMALSTTDLAFVDPSRLNEDGVDEVWVGPECFKKYPQLKPYKLPKA
jgi:hypothetical protein